jgi:hypothetical protein
MDNVTIELPAEITYPVSALSEDRTLEVGNVPVESIVKLLTYGVTQYVADGAAVDVHKRDEDGNHVKVDGEKVKRPTSDVAKDKVKGVNDRLAAILEGVFKTGGGGRALSAYDNELRALVKAVLVGKGIKLADATKAAKGPKAAIFDLAAKKAKATTAKVMDGDKVDAKATTIAVKDATEELFNVNWKVLTDKATALAAEHKDIDVDL